ncbi:MAG: hypothetical protein AB7I19_00390 [Planctomycetota bacterium]
MSSIRFCAWIEVAHDVPFHRSITPKVGDVEECEPATISSPRNDTMLVGWPTSGGCGSTVQATPSHVCRIGVVTLPATT